MLKIGQTALDCCAEVGTIAYRIERRDRALASQMRRAMASVALNVAEGCGSEGGNVRARYVNALGSAREVRAALEVALAFRHISQPSARLDDQLDKICATLFKLTR